MEYRYFELTSEGNTEITRQDIKTARPSVRDYIIECEIEAAEEAAGRAPGKLQWIFGRFYVSSGAP